jgi:TupA-like ATPgrasp
VTFTDKVRYKMLHDRRQLLVQWGDKVAAREYVAARVGEDLLPKFYLVTGDAASVRSDALPREFVLKPSHGALWALPEAYV